MGCAKVSFQDSIYMEKQKNKNVFENLEFLEWTSKNIQRLALDEEYFIKKYFIKKSARILEAGTGGGRIIFEIERLGFNNVVGYDFSQKMIDYAIKIKNRFKSIVELHVLDAIDLSIFPDYSFDYAVYLQQIISFIPNDKLRLQAMEEAYRILKPSGIALFSFLNWKGRKYNIPLGILLGAIRITINKNPNIHSLPWLKFGGKINSAFILPQQATAYWFSEDEIRNIITKVGFKIEEIKTNNYIYMACKK